MCDCYWVGGVDQIYTQIEGNISFEGGPENDKFAPGCRTIFFYSDWTSWGIFLLVLSVFWWCPRQYCTISCWCICPRVGLLDPSPFGHWTLKKTYSNPKNHWTLQWRGLNLYGAGVILGPQNDATFEGEIGFLGKHPLVASYLPLFVSYHCTTRS